MKQITNFNKKSLAGCLGAVLLLGLSGCITTGGPFGTPSRHSGNPVYTGRTMVHGDYVYFPDYDIYYNRTSRRFLSVENDRWVSRSSPRNVSANRVFASRSVGIDEYATPQQHRSTLYQQHRYQSGYQPISRPSRGFDFGRRVGHPRY